MQIEGQLSGLGRRPLYTNGRERPGADENRRQKNAIQDRIRFNRNAMLFVGASTGRGKLFREPELNTGWCSNSQFDDAAARIDA